MSDTALTWLAVGALVVGIGVVLMFLLWPRG
jgi:hypothetical protein